MVFNGKHICSGCFREASFVGDTCSYCGYREPRENAFPQALVPGTVVGGHYLLGRVLGQGGFGITYLAWDLNAGRKIALKEYFPQSMAVRMGQNRQVVPYSAAQEENFTYGRQQFLAEAGTLAQFTRCPGIVSVYACFEENGTAYFTMEYLEGEDLKDYVKDRGGRLGWEDTCRILLPVMNALETVHREGMIHRDVAPDNVFITRDGTVKLLDFGSARYSLGDRSCSLDVILKPAFSPKEQYTRRGRQGPFTDVYALGATIYYCVTGLTPPCSLDRVYEDELVLPSTLGVHLPEGVQEAIEKALEVRAEDRYQNVGQFRAALLKVDPEPNPEPPVPVPPGPNPGFDSKKLIAVLIGAIGVLAIALVAVLAIALGGGKKTEPTEPEDRWDSQVELIQPTQTRPPVQTQPQVQPEEPSRETEAPAVSEEPEEPVTQPGTVPTVEGLQWLTGEYSGQVDQDRPSGQGTLVWATGTYTGNFTDGKPSGEGTFTPLDGTPVTRENWSYGSKSWQISAGKQGGSVEGKYEGLLLDDRAKGYGVLQLADYGIYLGNFSEGYPFGWGAYQLADGSETLAGWWTWEERLEDTVAPGKLGAAMYYTGMVCDGSYCGLGILEFEKCGTFFGEFREGTVSGKGIYYFRCPGSKASVSGDNWSFVQGEYAYNNSYYGLKLGSQWTGFGIGVMSSGNHYAGEVLYDYRDGYGRVFLQNKSVDPNLQGIFRGGALMEKTD